MAERHIEMTVRNAGREGGGGVTFESPKEEQSS
jgi:hypothetical protein